MRTHSSPKVHVGPRCSGDVPHMCPAAAPSVGTGRDQVEREGTRKVNGARELKGSGASCFN